MAAAFNPPADGIALALWAGVGVSDIEFIQFGNKDVVRHKLVQRIVEAYKEHAEEHGTDRR